MTMLPWPLLLAGIPATKLSGNIFEITVQSMGPAQVGPYDELLKFVKSTKMYRIPVEVHHIVNGEHLDMTGWTYASAPCVVLSKGMHQQYHGRFSETVPEYGGRGMATPMTRSVKLELYHDMFVLQTGWQQLWTLAARIITGSVAVPAPRSFQTK